MEMSETNFLKKVHKSITDFEFYPLFLKESLGRAFLYLFMISLVFGIIGLSKVAYELNEGINFAVNYVKNDMPYFRFQNGKLNVEGDMPIIIEDGPEGIVVIDTTGKTNESILDKYERGIFINKHKLINKNNPVEKREIEFKQLHGVSFTKNSVIRLLPKLKLVNLIVIIGGIIFIFIGKIFSTLFVSLLGLIINSITKANLEYKDIYKLGIYSITLPTIIKVVANLLNYNIPFFFIIYYGIVIFYLWKSMSIIRYESDLIEY